MQGYLEKGIQTPRAQGRSTKIISMIKWIRTSRLSIKNSLSQFVRAAPLFVLTLSHAVNQIAQKRQR